jgi:hypothetical protein
MDQDSDSLITFGFSVYKFFQLEAPGRQRQNRLIGPREFAFMLVSIGLISLLLVAALISLLGILALSRDDFSSIAPSEKHPKQNDPNAVAATGVLWTVVERPESTKTSEIPEAGTPTSLFRLARSASFVPLCGLGPMLLANEEPYSISPSR